MTQGPPGRKWFSSRDEPSAKKWARLLGSSIGVLLFAGAIFAVGREGQSLGDAWHHLRDAPPLLVALALLLPALNWMIVSAAFVVLTRRFGRVGLGEMAALIGSAWLLNYLPMRPGMIGRVAYHKQINGIRVKDSARVLVESMVLAAPAIGLTLLLSRLLPNDPTRALILLGTPCLLGAILSISARKSDTTLRYTIAFVLRYMDVLVWIARYAVIFELIGSPLTIQRATELAAISQLVLLVPLAGNGLGLREWAIGLAADLGLVADLTHRAVEIVVAMIVGPICGILVARRLNLARSRSSRVATTDSAEPTMIRHESDPPF